VTVDRLTILGTIRDNLFARLDGASDRDAPSLVRQLTDVLEQIEAVERAAAPVKGTPLDELRARRRGRSSTASGGTRTASA
jgi:hypothetical protein